EAVGNGGRVLLTRAAYMSLSTAERERVEVSALGAVALRGVPRPVEMYQLDAVPGRTFAALRLDREVADLEEGGDDTSSSGVASMSTALDGPALAIVSPLAVVFGILAPPQRLKLLRPLCGRWRVDVPRAVRAAREEEVCRVAMERLAVKVSHVMEKGGCTPSAEGSRKCSLTAVSTLHDSRVFHILNAGGGGGGHLDKLRSLNSLLHGSLSATEKVPSELDDSDATIIVRPRV
ncbi:receptor-type adenylate cyclase, partial [Trypanosoma conorhini]